MRAFQLLLCCVFLAGCTRNASSLPTVSSSGDAPTLLASQQLHTSIASEPGFRTLYHFKGIPDGSAPTSALIALDGKLYGVTEEGGSPTHSPGWTQTGSVFEVSTTGIERVLYRFKNQADGMEPDQALLALNGKLYGTTAQGGSNGWAGTVFEVNRFGRERTLHGFDWDYGERSSTMDGHSPDAPLIAVDGKLYGTTGSGGNTDTPPCRYNGQNGCGTVFEMSTSGVEHVLYRFKGPPDGMGPGGLIALNGKFYGTTGDDGVPLGKTKNIPGTFYEVTKSGTERVLHIFRGDAYSTGPVGPLVVGNGKLYGVTGDGGSGACAYGCGIVFEITTSGVERVLYNFKGNPDGDGPNGGLIFLNNKLYGTTTAGGTSGYGTVFELGTDGTERVLHSFTHKPESPWAGLVALNGKLYGTTVGDGLKEHGTIFEVTP